MAGTFLSLNEMVLERVTEHFSRRTLVGQQEMVVWARLAAGGRADAHRHAHEQIFWILSGVMEMRVGDEKRTCRAGDVILIPGGIEHEGWCHEDAEFVTMLAPVRKDLLPGTGTPDHLKGS